MPTHYDCWRHLKGFPMNTVQGITYICVYLNNQHETQTATLIRSYHYKKNLFNTTAPTKVM